MRMRELRFKVVIILDKLTIYLISTRRKSGLQDEKSRVAVCRVRGDALDIRWRWVINEVGIFFTWSLNNNL